VSATRDLGASAFRRKASSGTVYLVGAGPGDPGLLTVRALELLRSADVVLHDHLVSPEILTACGSRVRLIDVGKIGHGRQVEQSAIDRQLVALARAGHSVVRLKGGDPFVFGRGAEEGIALRRAGIPFEVVPGVSSAIAAPAYAGIPLTARGFAASVAIVTGHCAHSDQLPEIPVADTIVVLMGIARAAAIRERLLNVGMRADTPVAVVEWGTSVQQRVTGATLATLPDAIARERVQAPAVIVIGKVVELRSSLAWFAPVSCIRNAASCSADL
jgi:uroporphyrin-III C-methyltransferase